MNDIQKAIEDWRGILGDSQVTTDQQAIQSASADTSPLRRKIPVVLYARSESDVLGVIEIARRYSTPLYPVSTGHNWGYGTANPTSDNCVLLDLSRMRQILEFDEDLGLVTLEPGVTQRQLSAFLTKKGSQFLVPVTGAGPNCSLLGNTLDRGYGITPIADHFSACMRIRAVLSDGSIFESPLSQLGGEQIDRSFKWGLGPYLDGIFTQSNMGVVTSMTIELARRPEQVVGFFFSVPKDEGLEEAVAAVRRILQATKGTSGSINLMNRRRVLSMIEPYPDIASGEFIPQDLLEAMARRNEVMAWTGAGALYGDRQMIAAAKKIIKRELRGTAKRLVFLTPASVGKLLGLAKWVPGKLGGTVRKLLGTLNKTLQLLNGAPSEIALPLCYWKSGSPPEPEQHYDPARDGCGLYWYSPLVPMIPNKVKRFTETVEQSCRKNGIEPLITLTSLSDKCWDSTIPILFDPQQPADCERAKDCYRELFIEGQKAGFVPYRSHVETMDWFVDDRSTFWRTAARIKSVLDPNGIIAPKRYSLR